MRLEQRDNQGNVSGVVVVSDDLLKTEPDAMLKIRGPKGSKAGPAPDGYDHITSQDGDTDAMVSDCSVHYYAKKGSYEKEKPSALSGLKAIVEPAKEPAKV